MANPPERFSHAKGLLQMFPQRNIEAALKHFSAAVDALEIEEWEKCIQKCGKFVEAIMKALGTHAGVTVLTGKSFKVGSVVKELEHRADRTKFHDSIRLVIPRNCTFIYDVASNRGGRHDASEIDSNRMDAIVCVENVSWVLAEMIRLSQKGALDPDAAAQVVEGLMEKRYPDIENIDGRFYVHQKGLSGKDVAIRILERIYPGRMHRDEIVATLRRHGEKEGNARMSVTRLGEFVDDDGDGNLKLRANGRKEAAEIRARERS